MSAPQKQAKVKIPLHLQLTQQDWEEICLTLNPAEIKVFMWIRAGDPFGDRELKINCGELGRRIGLSKSSISRAIRSLDEKKLIEIEIESVSVSQKISNRRLTLLTQQGNESNQEQKEENESVAPVQHPLHQCNTRCTSATPVAPVQHPLHQCNTQQLESLPAKESTNPHTLTDNSDLFQTLSEGERERFEKFCQKKIEQLPKKPSNPKAYIRKYRDDLYAEFQEEEARRKEVDEQIQASKAQPIPETPPTAANLHKRWLIKGLIRKEAIAKALELGYVVTPLGIFDPSEDPSEGNSSGGGGG